MEDNEKQNLGNNIKEGKDLVENAAKLGADIASGNVLGIIKDGINLLKNKTARKAIKMQIITTVLSIILIVGMFFVIVFSIKDAMVQLLNSAQTRVSSWWTWITDDNWIKLDEEKQYDGEDNQYTIIEKYIKELANNGISLKELRLLGEFDFSEEDQKLTEAELIEKIILNENNEYSEQKQLIEKYISEFVRADLITQSLHRRRGSEIVSPGNENWIDGGVFLYRAKNLEDVSDDAIEDGMYTTEVDGIDYVVMEYMDYNEFINIVQNQDNQFDSKKEKLRYRYTIDPNTGELIYVQIKTTEVIKGDISNPVGAWFMDLAEWIANNISTNAVGNKTVELTEVRVDYKQYISKYAMPYEFLVNLCMITQNPEFVYHVAMLGRDTKIVLAIHDDETIEEETVENEKIFVYYKNTENNSVSGATEVNRTTKKEREVTITTTMNASNLRVKYANAWSFYEEFEYTNVITKTTEPEPPLITDGEVDTHTILPGHVDAVPIKYEDIPGASGVRPVEGTGTPEYWYDDDYLISNKKSTQTTTITNTYKVPEKPKNSVHKSKQFLGLLRNETGECPYNCYAKDNVQSWKFARQCAQDAVFRIEGKNVYYQLPNSDRTDDPLRNLKSGEQMLYQLLGDGYNSELNNEETGEYEVSESENQTDVNSVYNQKLQKLLEHFKYLMTFPENEEYIIIDDKLVYDPDSDDGYSDSVLNLDDIIVKTDEPNAAPEVTKEELITIISKQYSGQQYINAMSLVDTLISGQKDHHVNPVFMLAVAQNETSMGTANSTYVKQHNNWTSWDLGRVFSSGVENMSVTINLIANGGIYFTQGKYTIKEIGYTFCPNDPPNYPTQGDKWVKDVTSTVKKLYSYIGTTITTDSGIIGGQYTSSSGKTYTIYYQNDYPNTPYWGGTVASKGCSVTADSIVLSGYGVNKNPAELLNGRTQISVDGELTNNGLSVTRTSSDLKAKIQEALNNGRPVVIHVNSSSAYTNNEHWMALLDINESNQVYVANPNRNGSQGWASIDYVLTGCTEIIVIND